MPIATQESDSMLEVEAGTAFEVHLGEAPTTGYGWELAHLPPGVELIGAGPTSADAAGDDEPGGQADDQAFRLIVTAPGRFELRFVLKRRWEQEPIEIRVVEVDAR
jgi:predicted secreted protein